MALNRNRAGRWLALIELAIPLPLPAMKAQAGLRLVRSLNGSKKAKPSTSCARHSFPAGTLVLMADGTAKPIEMLQEGDRLYAHDPRKDRAQGGRSGNRQITDLIEPHPGDQLIEITIDGTALELTANHPMWSVDREDWIAAGQLAEGELMRGPQGDPLPIESIRPIPGSETVYDITVRGLHSYYVVVGDVAVLVHNCGVNKGLPRDFPSEATVNRSALFGSEREARALAREKVGHNPIEVAPHKLRTQDGAWQYRAKPGDADKGHVHLERLNPKTGEVLENWHLNWSGGS